MKDKQSIWVVSNINEEQLLPLHVDKANEISALPKSPPYAVILAKNINQDWVELVGQLRSTAEYRYIPVFYHGAIDPNIEHIFDGPADEHIHTRAAAIYERMDILGPQLLRLEDEEAILLTYLFTRVRSCISGHKSVKNRYIFEYPLLKILLKSFTEACDQWLFLEEFVKRDLMAHDKLLDETKNCGSCESGLLNIKSTCPSCRSINIQPQKLVHCYNCGNIGAVPEFLRQERLVCSQCHVRLHELGVDYEMPLEDKICNSCGHFFAFADVKLICLVCERASTDDELRVRRLHTYVLTRRGEYLVRGIEKSIYRQFSHFFKVIDYQVFMAIASWQAKLAVRYSSTYFSIMTLQITNEDELIAEKGALDSELLMTQLFTSLRQVFRESDLSSRLGSTMFFLLPMAGLEGCLIILERIKATVNTLAQEDIGKGLIIGLSYMTSAEVGEDIGNGDLVIAEFHAKLVESNMCLIGAR